jgi:hypothetical protein
MGTITGTAIARGDQLPHFEVTTVHGEPFSYASIWQLKSLALLTLPSEEEPDRGIAELLARRAEFDALKSVCVITRECLAGMPTPGVLIADRWGEVVHIAATAEIPTATELLDWLNFVERRCPECEGETR